MSRMILIGDLQRTLLIERLFGREQNDAERIRILEAAADEATDETTAEAATEYWFLGDLVDVGGLTASWNFFDRCAQRIFAKPQSKFALFGNHDYWGIPSNCRKKMRSRFPSPESEIFQSHRNQGVLILALDSNRSVIGHSKWEQQERWFRDSLIQAENDPTISDVLVFSHHPPFTNSKRYSGHPVFAKFWVPEFLNSLKARAWISGHVHAYEHFKKQGKHFVVMGSSGGPRAPLHSGKAARHQDQFAGEDPRPFVFTVLDLTPESLRLVVKGFQKHDIGIQMIDQFELRTP